MKDLLHVTGGGGLLRTAPFSRAEVRRVPVPPVVLGVRLIVAVVVLRRIALEFCENYGEPINAVRVQSAARRRWQRRLR